MFGRLMPKEGRFFDLFNQHAGHIIDATIELVALMNNVAEGQKHIYNIESCEKRGDRIAREVIDLLHKTFITPLDRDDIHLLITRMDDVLDLTEDVAQCVYLYDLQTITPEAKKLAEICVACGEKVRDAVALLPNMENGPKIRAVCTEIDKLESEADHVMRAAMAKLFRDEPDVRQVIKLKAVYELLETITDRCEDVANIIEGIVVENA
ncbi:MAG: DUF47 domain-containing protein [Betaproteobacteria bacterium]